MKYGSSSLPEELGGASGLSHVGRQGGRQEILLLQTTEPPDPTELADRGTVLHEIGHALGLWHEHQRMDRDEHIEILEENIDLSKQKFLFWTLKDPKRVNFGRKVTDGIDIGPYDPNSIMHYHSQAFGKIGPDGQRLTTIRHRLGLHVGRGNTLTALDVEGLRQLYPGRSDGLGVGDVPHVFHHSAFGEGVAFHTSCRDLEELSVNDEITGLRVPAGWEIILYRHSDFRGEHVRFAGPTELPDLSKLEMLDAKGRSVMSPLGVFPQHKMTWNDEASSVAVVGPAANIPPDCNRVTLFADSFWRGRRLAIDDWQDDLRKNVSFSDVTSAICVPAGLTVELFEHRHYEGQSVRIVGPMEVGNFHDAPDGRNWGDRISSMRILGGPGEEREKQRLENLRKQYEAIEKLGEPLRSQLLQQLKGVKNRDGTVPQIP